MYIYEGKGRTQRLLCIIRGSCQRNGAAHNVTPNWFVKLDAFAEGRNVEQNHKTQTFNFP